MRHGHKGTTRPGRAVSYAQRTTHATRDRQPTSIYSDPMPPSVPPSDHGHDWAKLLLAARKRKGLTQEDVADLSGVSRRTLTRWEGGNAEKTHPAGVRAVCQTLGIHLADAAVALGYLDHEPSTDPPPDPTLEEITAMWRDPRVPDSVKWEGLRYLQYLWSQPPVSGEPGEAVS